MKVKRSQVENLVYAAAHACAHGPRQESLINELLDAEIRVEQFVVPAGSAYGKLTLLYGQSRVQHASWKSLYKRLVAAGFVVTRVRVTGSTGPYYIRIHHPILNKI